MLFSIVDSTFFIAVFSTSFRVVVPSPRTSLLAALSSVAVSHPQLLPQMARTQIEMYKIFAKDMCLQRLDGSQVVEGRHWKFDM